MEINRNRGVTMEPGCQQWVLGPKHDHAQSGGKGERNSDLSLAKTHVNQMENVKHVLLENSNILLQPVPSTVPQLIASGGGATNHEIKHT